MDSHDLQHMMDRGMRETTLASLVYSHVHSRNGGKTWFGKVRTRAGAPKVRARPPFSLTSLTTLSPSPGARPPGILPNLTQSDHHRTWTTPVYNLEEEAARAVDRFLYKMKKLARERVELNFPDAMTVSIHPAPLHAKAPGGGAPALRHAQPVASGTRARTGPGRPASAVPAWALHCRQSSGSS